MIIELLDFDRDARLYLIILFLSILIYYQSSKSPYSSNIFNELENRSSLSIVSIIFFSLIRHYKTDELTRVLTSLVILLTNISFLYIWIIQVLSTQYDNIVIFLKCIPKIQKIVIEIKKEFDLVENEYRKNHSIQESQLSVAKKVRLSISKAMRRISQVIVNQKKSIEKRMSKMVENFNNRRISRGINKT